MAGNREDGEDLLQQSILEAYAAFDRFEVGTRFDCWMYRIMHHTLLDMARRRPRHAIQPLDAVWETAEGDVMAHDVLDPHAGPESELMAQTLSEPIQQALDALPPKLRSVIILVDMQDQSYDDAASSLRCPMGTVRSRLHRARAALRRALCGGAVAAAAREDGR
jgi:RNA polymerase sigma-70 factor (ECF subfamily)